VIYAIFITICLTLAIYISKFIWCRKRKEELEIQLQDLRNIISKQSCIITEYKQNYNELVNKIRIKAQKI
jgi:cell division protein FtsL